MMDFKLASVVSRVADAQAQLEEAQERAEEALTVWMEGHLAELAERFPKRRFRASSGMGSLSIEISGAQPLFAHHPDRSYIWIWGVDERHLDNPVLDRLYRQWQALLDDFAEQTGLRYVNFTRVVVVTGKDYGKNKPPAAKWK